MPPGPPLLRVSPFSYGKATAGYAIFVDSNQKPMNPTASSRVYRAANRTGRLVSNIATIKGLFAPASSANCSVKMNGFVTLPRSMAIPLRNLFDRFCVLSPAFRFFLLRGCAGIAGSDSCALVTVSRPFSSGGVVRNQPRLSVPNHR